MAISLAGFGILLVIAFLGFPLGFSMIIVGFAGFAIIRGTVPALETVSQQILDLALNANFVTLPLFVLMGNLASISGMSRDLYGAAYAWFGHWRGGLASATIAACAGFAALSGSSVASAVTMGRVSLPEMKRFDYDSKLATGCIAAGGTLGILIPPSTGFIIYAILTEESIGRLFLAGVFPGILLAVLFMITIYIQTRINPKLGPAGPRSPMRDKVKTLSQATAMVFIVVVTIGGIYGGVFTPTEAAAVGAMLSFLLTLVRRRLTWNNLSDILLQTIRTTGLVFLILIGAHVFNPFLALTHIPDDLASLLIGADLSPHLVMLILMAAYIVLGSFLEGFAMLVLTLPIVHPMIIELGFDPIWFGVLIVIIIEIGLITPPVGVNVFVVKGIAGDVPLRDIFAGVIPFWFAMMACILILMAFPEIALFLPNTMIQSN